MFAICAWMQIAVLSRVSFSTKLHATIHNLVVKIKKTAVILNFSQTLS
jgi:hypothetical protein